MSRVPRKGKRTLPLVEERATVVKSRTAQGFVRLKKRVNEQETQIDETLHGTEYEIRRVPCDLWIDGPVPVRTEGATTIYPVLHEIAVVTRRLKLVEEVHVTRRERVRSFTDSVPVRREEIAVERTEKREADHNGEMQTTTDDTAPSKLQQ
jgi:stress response protein YsnF